MDIQACQGMVSSPNRPNSIVDHRVRLHESTSSHPMFTHTQGCEPHVSADLLLRSRTAVRRDLSQEPLDFHACSTPVSGTISATPEKGALYKRVLSMAARLLPSAAPWRLFLLLTPVATFPQFNIKNSSSRLSHHQQQHSTFQISWEPYTPSFGHTPTVGRGPENLHSVPRQVP